MAKKVTRIAKLQFKAGQAKPGPELAGLGIDMGGFTKEFNDATKDRSGDVVPVVITAYSDRSFEFILKTTPASNLLMKAAKIQKGASKQDEPVATISKSDVEEIAKHKLVDLNTNNIDAAIKIIEGTARNMGIIVEGMTPQKNTKGKKDKPKTIDTSVSVEDKEEDKKEGVN